MVLVGVPQALTWGVCGCVADYPGMFGEDLRLNFSKTISASLRAAKNPPPWTRKM